jgi:hypothetical protein
MDKLIKELKVNQKETRRTYRTEIKRLKAERDLRLQQNLKNFLEEAAALKFKKE